MRRKNTVGNTFDIRTSIVLHFLHFFGNFPPLLCIFDRVNDALIKEKKAVCALLDYALTSSSMPHSTTRSPDTMSTLVMDAAGEQC